MNIKSEAALVKNDNRKSINYCIKSSDSGCHNKYGLYNVIGNVAELVDAPRYVRGGDWFHSMKEARALNEQKVNVPNFWTGLRCVSEFKLFEKNN